MADEREQQIRERVEHWRLNHWHCQVCGWWGPQCCTCPNCGSDTGKPLVSDAEDLTYLLDRITQLDAEAQKEAEVADNLLDALAAAREELERSAGHTAEECEADAIQAEYEKVVADLAAAREENGRLGEALVKYGRHQKHCAAYEEAWPCECGWDDALAALAREATDGT